MVNLETQKLVIKPNLEYFSSSHADVFQNRLISPSIENPPLEKTLKPYKKKVKYRLSKRFISKFHDVGYKVFNLMM